MDWGIFLTALITAAITYSIGKGVGRAQAHEESTPVVRLTLEVNGDPVGGLTITGLRTSDHLDP